MSTIDTLLQNQPQPQPSSSKRSSEGPSSPSSSKRGRLDDSPPPESFYPSTSSGSVADLLALPRLAPPKPIKTKAPRKPRKSTSKKTVSVSVPVVDASNPPPSRIVLRLPFFNPSTSTSLIASEPSPCIKAKLELPLSPPPPPPPPPPSAPAPVVASPSTSNRRAPRASLPRFALPALPKLNES
ncbi:hypothetical protein BDY24DRAFT_276175 [Mrakia frigida]|uniref:uncharacterized protein n=1 Tax=Mrakia frigida TaxID=29902 RepID=UPI003FCC224A